MRKLERKEFIFENLEDLFVFLEKKRANTDIIWFGISGSWRKTNKEIEEEVRKSVRKIIQRGHGIISGGALSVDYFATDETLKTDPNADKIKVFLPTTLELYAAHYRKRAKEGVILAKQAESLIAQLKDLQKANPEALICNFRNREVNPETYFERNTCVVEASDAIVAFQVNNSEGVEDTCNKALLQEKPIYLKKYIVD